MKQLFFNQLKILFMSNKPFDQNNKRPITTEVQPNPNIGVKIGNKAHIPCNSFNYYYTENDEIEGILDGSTAEALRRYYDSQCPPITSWDEVTEEKVENVEDAKSIWFPLEKLKKFFWYIEHYSCKSKCGYNPDMLGVRIFYARYPAHDSELWNTEPSLMDVPKRYANRHTLYMIPTYYDEKAGKDVDFNPRLDCEIKLELTKANIATAYKKVTTTPVLPEKFLKKTNYKNESEILAAKEAKTLKASTKTNLKHFNAILSLGSTIRPLVVAMPKGVGGTTTVNAQNHGGLTPPDGTA